MINFFACIGFVFCVCLVVYGACSLLSKHVNQKSRLDIAEGDIRNFTECKWEFRRGIQELAEKNKLIEKRTATIEAVIYDRLGEAVGPAQVKEGGSP